MPMARSPRCATSWLRRPSHGTQIGDQIRQPLGPQPDVGAVGAHVDALHEQLHNAGLLGREQLVPQQIEPGQRLAHLGFVDALHRLTCCAPSADDDFRGTQQAAQMVKSRNKSDCGWHPAEP